MATVRVSAIQLKAGLSSAKVRVGGIALTTGAAATPVIRVAGMRLLTGPAASLLSPTVRVARLRLITGSPQIANVQMYRWDGNTLQPVKVGRWTGSTVEYLTP